MIAPNGTEILTTLEDLVDPRHTALLIYDMQAGIVPQIAEGPAILSRVLALLTAARHARLRIIFTRHLSLPTQWMGSFQYRMAMAWQRKQEPADVKAPFLRDSPAFQLAAELQPQPDEVIFDKVAMSAFEGTPLITALRDCGIRSLIIAGIALEIGIEPTCRHAADLGIVPILVQDACGAGNPEAADHCIAALKHMGDTMVTDLATITSLLSRSPK